MENTDAFHCLSTRDVLQDMMKHELPLTTEAFALWRAHLRGENGKLSRLLNIMASNGIRPDQATLAMLHARYIGPLPTQEAMQGLVAQLGALLPGDAPSGAGAGTAAIDTAMANSAIKLTLISMMEEFNRYVNDSRALIAGMQSMLSEAHQDAFTDALTGLPNRRAFDVEVKLRAAQAMNSGEPLSILFGDVDHFKKVNDTYGHNLGDEVLRSVAREMRDAVRGRDFVARYGGEEFAFLLPNTSMSAAASVAENVRHSVKRCPIQVDDGVSMHVTASFGVSTYEVGESLRGWITRADTALYLAKDAGRDRVTIAAATPDFALN